MQNIIERFRYLDVAAHVMINKPKPRVLEKCADVLLCAGGIIVHAKHLIAVIEEALAQVRANKSGAARHQVSRHRAESFLNQDRKSTRLNSSHPSISYAVFCLK